MLLTLLGVMGCSPKNISSLEGSWKLFSIGSANNPTPVMEETKVTAVFTQESETQNGEVVGTASCNRYFGSFETDGNKLAIGSIGNTEMFCMSPEGVMEQEKQFLTALGAATEFKVEGDKLQIFYSGDKVLTFSRMDE